MAAVIKEKIDKIILFVALATLLLAPLSATKAQASYIVGDTITVPISFTAASPVVLIEFTVSVQNGQLVSLQCGGSGFTFSLPTTANSCTGVHLAPGLTGAVVGTAQVKATTVGTLTVSATGQLSGLLGAPITGQYHGGTFTISEKSTATTPTPTSSSTASAAPTTQPSGGVNTNTNQTTSTTKATDTVTSSSQTTQSSSSDRSSATQNSTPATSRSAVTSSNGDSRVVLTNQETAGLQPTIIGQPNEMIFAAGALLPTNSDPIILNLPEEPNESWLNFQAYMKAGSNPPQVILPQAVTLVKTVDDLKVAVRLPKDLVISPALTNTEASAWDGRVLAPMITFDRENEMVTVGNLNQKVLFSRPIELIFYDRPLGKVGLRQLATDPLQEITAQCSPDIATTHNLLNVNECYLHSEGNTHIWTNHATQYVMYAGSTVSVLAGITVLGLGLLFIVLTIWLLRHLGYAHRPTPLKQGRAR